MKLNNNYVITVTMDWRRIACNGFENKDKVLVLVLVLV